jgi:hypothetical protein
MPFVYISFDPAAESLLSGLITMPKQRFKNLPILPAEVDDHLFEVLSRIDEFYLHKSNFGSYLPILRSLDAVAEERQPTVTNISLSPGPSPFEPREPINVASRIAASVGHVSVFAAGNDGPKQGTLSPWSVAPWVIGVGATTKNGDALLPESSIGDPGDPLYRPTIVAPGETVVPLREDGTNAHGTMVALVLIGKDYAGRNLPGCKDVAFRGTSVSSPKVARICEFIILTLRIFLSVDRYLKGRIKEDSSDNAFLIERICAEILERGGIDHPGFGVLHGISPASLAPMLEFFARLSVRGAYPAEFQWPSTASTPFPTSVIKRMLKSMARAMPEYGPHQVGAGFVSEELAMAYLSKISAAEFLRLLFPSDWKTLVGGWQDSDTPLVPAELLTELKRRVSGSKPSSYKVL